MKRELFIGELIVDRHYSKIHNKREQIDHLQRSPKRTNDTPDEEKFKGILGMKKENMGE